MAPLKDRGLDVLNSPHRCAGRTRAIALFYFTDETAEQLTGCTQNSDLSFTVELEVCDGRSHSIAYPYLAAIKILLNWHEPGVGRTSRIQYVSTSYVPFQDTNGFKWLYSMNFKLRRVDCKKKNIEKALAEVFDDNDDNNGDVLQTSNQRL